MLVLLPPLLVHLPPPALQPLPQKVLPLLLVLLLTRPKVLLTPPAQPLLKLPRKLLTQLLPQSRSLNSQASRRVQKEPPQGGFFLPEAFCLKPFYP